MTSCCCGRRDGSVTNVLRAVATAFLAGALLLPFHTPTPASADDATYRLPWEARQTFGVVQGNYATNDGRCVSACGYTHRYNLNEHYAWDFDLPEDTKIVAVRAGRVARLPPHDWPADHCGDHYPMSNPPKGYIVSPNIGNEGNYVVIDHGDGTAALYLHLSKIASTIRAKLASGQPVAQGEELGLSGKTGWTKCDPHLHFQVEALGGSWYTESRPIQFADPDVVNKSPSGVPAQGQRYTSNNAAQQQISQTDWRNATYTITCDRNAPADFNVRLVDGAATISGTTAGSTDYDQFEVQYQSSADGDVDGDGSQETAVLLRCSPQPSNFTVQEVLVLHADGSLMGKLPDGASLKAGAILPPQYVPNELAVKGGNVTTGMLAYAQDDNHASGPSNHLMFAWHWNGSAFQRQR
jgi:murein DD-endopeptidase MepM/ murein hydrolase activator NlpD